MYKSTKNSVFLMFIYATGSGLDSFILHIKVYNRYRGGVCMRGPIDYIVVGFDGNNFTGEILEELDKAVNSGAIAVLELAVIIRDEDGNVAAAEVTDEKLSKLMEELTSEPGLISDDDIEETGDLLEDGTSAGLLIVEHLWAKGLKKAIMDSGGTLLMEGRIHPEASKELEV